jgi:hypothetical protein
MPEPRRRTDEFPQLRLEMRGPVVIALLVEWTESRSGALPVIALAGLFGAVLWMFVHPERRPEVLAPLVSAAEAALVT